MKICPHPFTYKHKEKALIRIFRELIFGKIKWAQLNKFYSAMLYLERYLEKLDFFKLKGH